MLAHHAQSALRAQEYYAGREGVIAVILGGSVAKGCARPDSDIDLIVAVTEELHAELRAQGRTAEIVTGHCTYEGGYFDVKYKTLAWLRAAAEHGSEPTRNAYVGARVLWQREDVAPLIARIGTYPEHEAAQKLECFCANLQLNRGYFLKIVPEENAYMRAHLAQQIVYSVYRLILLENRVLFPCNRRLEEAVLSCSRRPKDIVALGRAFLQEITEARCEAFVNAFRQQSALALFDDVSRCQASYVKFYEDWWGIDGAPLPDEW